MLYLESTMETKNKGGRPSAIGTPRTKVIQIAFTAEEKKQLTDLAYSLDLSIAMLARRALREWITKECEQRGCPCPAAWNIRHNRRPTKDVQNELTVLSLPQRNQLRIDYLTSSQTGATPESLAMKYGVSIAAVLSCKEAV
jgi:hypothetical protein